MKQLPLIAPPKILTIAFLTFILPVVVFAQKPKAPTPVEFMFGNNEIYSQLVIKKAFYETSRFNFFGLATFSANYENDVLANRALVISQVSYEIAHGFGVMAGADYNSFSGLSAIVGPQHNFANKEFLAVTTVSFFLNESADAKIFGLYEYKPKLSDNWNLYTRFQFIYNHSLGQGDHNKSYIYLRAGLKKKALNFGLGANFDWSGPNKIFKENYGPFIRWEFN